MSKRPEECWYCENVGWSPGHAPVCERPDRAKCPMDGQTREYHLHIAGTHSDGSPRTNGEFMGCDFAPADAYQSEVVRRHARGGEPGMSEVQRNERAEATHRDWGIEPNAEVDAKFRRDVAEINRAEGRTVLSLPILPAEEASEG